MSAQLVVVLEPGAVTVLEVAEFTVGPVSVVVETGAGGGTVVTDPPLLRPHPVKPMAVAIAAASALWRRRRFRYGYQGISARVRERSESSVATFTFGLEQYFSCDAV